MSSIFQFLDLEGKHLVITGVTSGIGRALLSVLLEQRVNLIAVSRGLDEMQAIRGELGVDEARLRLFDCDLCDPAAVNSTAQEILQTTPRLDGILNNAGIIPRERFSSGDDAFWNNTFQVNLFSAVSLTRSLLPRLQASPQGRILFTGSVLFELGGACLSAYSATKGALVGLTRALAHELKSTAITVNCVVPGAIATENNSPGEDIDHRLIGWQSVQRRLVAQDLAGLVCLLLSQAGEGICGQAITVDGGIVHPLASPEQQGRNLPPMRIG